MENPIDHTKMKQASAVFLTKIINRMRDDLTQIEQYEKVSILPDGLCLDILERVFFNLAFYLKNKFPEHKFTASKLPNKNLREKKEGGCPTMRVIKQQASITMIVVIDDEAPGPDWLKQQLEKMPGVAISRIEGFANEDVLSICLGPQKQKKEG